MTDPTRQRIEELVKSHGVLLFMKGDRRMPQCGFSATVVQILERYRRRRLFLRRRGHRVRGLEHGVNHLEDLRLDE